ncbi:MAG: lipid A biosynthesis acyltransferase, partial [Negativicutes bacterium]|nr:lipid A biosynthesis acyltransferase [Negativicutes bacterium]
MVYRFWLLAARLVGLLPAWLLPPLAAGLGLVAWFLIPGWRRDMAISNACCCLGCGERQARRIVRSSVANLAMNALEFARLPGLGHNNLACHVEFCRREVVDEALDRGRGVILVTGHCGNWELLGAALAIAGIPTVAVAARQHGAAADRLINRLRSSSGMEVA